MKRKGSKNTIKNQLPICITNSEESVPLSQSSLHNYFAAKMAQFSLVMGYLSEKQEQSRQAMRFGKVKDKLSGLRTDFLTKYHQLGRNKGGLPSQTDRIREIFELVYRFENAMIEEISGAGLQLSGFGQLQESHETSDC